jgi:hypothetical protein
MVRLRSAPGALVGQTSEVDNLPFPDLDTKLTTHHLTIHPIGHTGGSW